MKSKKFKVGDSLRCVRYVPYKDTIFIFSKHDINFAFNDIVDKNCELWQPKKGEWCWFWNNAEDYTLEKYFTSIHGTDGLSITSHYSTKSPKHWDYIEPFTNSLPSFLKDL